MGTRLRRTVALFRAAAADYSRHACSELAAAIAYRVLFSLVPFVALLAAVLDAVLPDSARADVVDWLLGALPGTEVQASVERELATSGTLTSVAGLIALGTLMWTASGMTRSVRVALAVVWEADVRTAFVRAKLRDLAALGLLAALVIGGFVLSLVAQIAVQAGVNLGQALGLGQAASIATTAVELLVTGLATFAGLLIVYLRVAPVKTRFAAVWPSALITAVAIDAGVAGYALYLVRFASFSSVYGPLGIVLVFLALLYVAAMLLLFGAELIVAGHWAPAARGVGPISAPTTHNSGKMIPKPNSQ